MTDNEFNARLETLEMKFSHQDAGLEEMARTLVRLEQLVKNQAADIERLEARLRALTPTDIGAHDDQTPPHY